MTTAIIAELLPDAGAPQAGVTVTGLDPDSDVVSIQVSWDAGDSWHAVSGGDHLDVSGGAFVRDHFAPLNLATTYRVIEHSLSGEPATESDELTVTSTVSWLQDALDPRSAVSLVSDHWPSAVGESLVLFGSLSASVWAQAIDLAQVMGADRPVGSVGQRMIAGQTPMQVSHELANEGGEFQRLLKQAGQVVLRTAARTALDPVAFIVTGDVNRNDYAQGTTGQVTTWDLTATQVRPLNLRFIVPWWTYEQIETLWAGSSYADVSDANPGATYLDIQKDPTP